MSAERQRNLSELLEEHGERQRRFWKNYREKTDIFLQTLLPDIESSTLERLHESGFQFGDDLVTRIEADRERCEEELNELEDHPALQETQTDDCLTVELEKLESHFNALQPFLKKCFQHPRFDDLLLDGYGTSEYKKKFWHLSYHVDRKAAKEIVELCGGIPFSKIRAEAVQALEASKVLQQRIESLKVRRKQRTKVLRRQRTLRSRLQTHQQIWLDSARRQLLSIVEGDPVDTVEKCRELCPEEVFEWRLSKELSSEHQALKNRFLEPARSALEENESTRFDLLLDEYHSCAAALKRFDKPSAPKETIDWKKFIYSK